MERKTTVKKKKGSNRQRMEKNKHETQQGKNFLKESDGLIYLRKS